MSDLTAVALDGDDRWIYTLAYVNDEEAMFEWEHVRLYAMPDDLLDRFVKVMDEFWNIQNEVSALINPRCPECGHPGHRHQTTTYGDFRCLGWGDQCQCMKVQPPNPNLVPK